MNMSEAIFEKQLIGHLVKNVEDWMKFSVKYFNIH